jgi:hypothetical protein
LATLTSKVSRGNAKIMALLEEKARLSLSHEGLAKPLLILSREAEEASLAAAPAPKAPSPQSLKSGDTEAPSGTILPPPTPSTSNLPAASSPSSRMMKIAADELQKIKKNHPEQYAELKKAYLDSLDEGGRKLIFDVQKRMQSHLFEEHLRQRILRFMVENPGAWRSAESPYAKNT